MTKKTFLRLTIVFNVLLVFLLPYSYSQTQYQLDFNQSNIEFLNLPSPNSGFYPSVPNTSGKPLYVNSFSTNHDLPSLAEDIYLPAGPFQNTFFGGDDPNTAGFGHVPTMLIWDKKITETDFPILLEADFFNRSTQAAFNESYFWLGNQSHEFFNPGLSTLPNPDIQEGLVIGGIVNRSFIQNGETPNVPSKRYYDIEHQANQINDWYKMKAVIDLNTNNKLVIRELKINGISVLAQPVVIDDMSYFVLNNLQLGICVDDFAKNFKVTFNHPIETKLMASACDSFNFDGALLTESGVYTREYVTGTGCDSIVILNLTINESSRTNLSYSLCTNDSISVNDIIYKEAGTYTQNFLNASGCDSTLVISIEVNDLTEGNVEYKLCDGESVLVNDILYSDAGTFQQTLKNAGGCDSLLTIQIIKGLSTSSSHIFSLCNQSTVVFNGITYTTAAVFEQVIPNNSGCDSTLYITVLPCTVNATYDFQQCNALTPENSMTYNEFLPTYRSPISCGEVILTNVFRENPQDQKHSCSAGQASSLSMCVGASSSCTFEEADQEPVTFGFEAKPTDGSSIRFNHLEFYHLSPSQFSWIQGASGANNYPSRFSLTVYINDVVVFQRTDLSTGNQWTKEKFDFFEDDKFTLQAGDSVIIELTPYCQTANGGNVSVWDVDNIGLFFSCKDTDNRQVGGRIAGSELAAMDVVVQRKTGDRILQQITNNGSFLFTKNDPFTSYEFKAYNDENAAANISTLDLVLIQKHILQVTPFENPLQFVAADVNNDGKVNTIDLVELRKIILGIQERFAHNTSWRMIPVKNMDVQQNPLLWEDTYYLLPGYHHMMDLDFVPVKIGDIDGAKDFNLFVKPPQTTKN